MQNSKHGGTEEIQSSTEKIIYLDVSMIKEPVNAMYMAVVASICAGLAGMQLWYTMIFVFVTAMIYLFYLNSPIK
jgi:hypothetical protein